MRLARAPAASDTSTATSNVPAVAGVPLMTPEEEFSDSPDGIEPDHVNGARPPVAVSVAEYTTPVVPGARDSVVIVKPEVMVKVNSLLACSLFRSVTRTVKVKEPAAAGVPVIVPVDALIDSP